MKKIIISILLMSTAPIFANTIKIIKKATNVQVIELQTKTTCKEIDSFDDDADFDCNLAALRKNISKKVGSIVKIEGLNKNSRYVLNNSVDDEGTYNINVRVLFYE